MSKFVVREYAIRSRCISRAFRGAILPLPHPLVHLNKLRLYRHACPAGTGPSARIHIEYDATVHAAVPVGVPLRVKGTVVERLVKRGREYVMIDIELRTVAGDRLLIAYRDTVIVAYRSKYRAHEGVAS
jgi:hypothetical protein